MNNYKSIIKYIRNELHVSQTELANILGVSFATVNRWENGHFKPSLKIQRKIIIYCKENNIKLS